jgi:hypothetical protein
VQEDPNENNSELQLNYINCCSAWSSSDVYKSAESIMFSINKFDSVMPKAIDKCGRTVYGNVVKRNYGLEKAE